MNSQQEDEEMETDTHSSLGQSASETEEDSVSIPKKREKPEVLEPKEEEKAPAGMRGVIGEFWGPRERDNPAPWL